MRSALVRTIVRDSYCYRHREFVRSSQCREPASLEWCLRELGTSNGERMGVVQVRNALSWSLCPYPTVYPQLKEPAAMTLLDAPKYDEARARRRQIVLWACVGTVVVLFIGFWIVAGRPVDFPWNWMTHLRGRSTINTFLKDVEKDDLADAYGIWIHDPEWQ